MPQKVNTFCLGMCMQAGLDGRTPQATRQKRQGRVQGTAERPPRTTAAVVITYSTSACYTDSATPMRSGSICIRDVVWWWKFHSRWYIRFSLGQREANNGSEEVLSRGVSPPGIGGVCLLSLTTHRRFERCMCPKYGQAMVS